MHAKRILCLTLGLSLAAAAAQAGVVASVKMGATDIEWQPQVAFDRLTLIVSGPGDFYLRQEFGDTTNPSLTIFDSEGNPFPDGVYSYELRTTPRLSAELRQGLIDARSSADANLEAEMLRRVPAGAVQSGYFSVQGGELITPDASEAPLTPRSPLQSAAEPLRNIAGQVVLTNGDGVIRNSLCVGFDCPDAPVFSDSTILLMENNTRIKFGDTSNAPFPNNDWEIEANSSLSGGANYLGFNDCGNADNDGGCATDLVFAVEAGARQNALYVESDGDVGLGTSNPVVDLHIVTGNTPTLRLDQDGSSGFAPQVWDLAGNETNFFVRDVTGGSLLPFRIRPGAPTSSIDIAASGNVGVGTASPGAPLHVLDNGSSFTDGQLFVENTNGTAGERVLLKLENNGKTRFELRNTSGTPTSWTFDNNGNTFTISKVGTGVNEASLDGSGNLVIQGSLTTGTTVYPDFVFDPGYDLMPLPDLGAFIERNGHLPTMPTAEEVLKKGSYNMTELQMKLLQKVEELTLYTLTQERQLTELVTENSTLKDRISNLENLLNLTPSPSQGQ